MKLMVIGAGGREHALAWRLLQSPRVKHVFVAPGNGGTACMHGTTNVALTDPVLLADFVRSQGITLTVVGPEAPLAQGVVDVFRGQGLQIFGPTRAAAQLESSKDFAKAFMVRHRIPTAAYQTFSDPLAAHGNLEPRRHHTHRHGILGNQSPPSAPEPRAPGLRGAAGGGHRTVGEEEKK